MIIRNNKKKEKELVKLFNIHQTEGWDHQRVVLW